VATGDHARGAGHYRPADAPTPIPRGRGPRHRPLAPATAWARPEALKLVGRRQLDARLVELTLRTGALSRPTPVRVLLPRGVWELDGSTRRYPVLYLLHGANDDYRSWTRSGDAERLTDGLGLIVVMPTRGRIGG
jgi:diacylglycerol O-acyltransferase / trehalose O-mycolyltransferase